MISKNYPRIFLTFDVEEWTFLEKYNPRSKYNKNTEFSKQGCLKLLDLLKSYNIKATFFVTGHFAEREPQLIESLALMGHEVASHAHADINLTKIKKDDLRLVIAQSTDVLSKLASQKIKGFRAPGCRVNKDIIEILNELDYQYDSSVHPAIVPGRYYNWKYPLVPFFFSKYSSPKDMNKEILEIPLSVVPLIRFPISWWWMRNIGNWITYFGTWINLYQRRDVVLYFHSWEYAKLPHISGLPLHFVRGCGDQFLKNLEKFINVYINKFQFHPLEELARRYARIAENRV